MQALVAKQCDLPKSIQDMMLPQRKGHSWPTPNPASIFQSVAATEGVFEFFTNEFPCVVASAAWVSVLAQTSHFVANAQDSSLWKVVAGAEFGFLGRRAAVEVVDGVRFFVLKPQKNCCSGSILWICSIGWMCL